MSLGHGAKIVKDGLVFAYDMGSTRSYGKNAFQYSTDLYSWFNVGARCTLERDTIQSPVGNTPLKMTVTSDTDPYTNTYSGSQWIITEAVQGETWTASCWVRSSVPTTSAIWIFESNVNGAYTSISNPSYSINSEWQRITTTRTMTDATTASITIRFDGPDSLGNGVEIWYDGLQLERNSSASSFSKIYNPNQKEIVDWAGDNTITSSSLTYNSDNTFSFNGSSNYLDVGSGFTETTLSIELMVKPGSSQVQYADIIDNNHTNSRGWVIQQNSTTLNQYYFYTTGSTVNFSLTANVWQHVVCTHNPSTNTKVIYINGEQVASGAAPAINYDGTEFLRLGRWGGGGRYWNGVNAMTRIYRRALSATEVKQNFNALRGRFGI